MIRRIAIVAAFLIAGLGALAVRVVVEGRAALRAGDDADARCHSSYDARPAHAGPPDQRPCFEAIDAYETAARWYFPLAPHVDEAYDNLRRFTGSLDPGTQLAAWRAIRSAARATRSLWTPHADDLAAADAAIARLSAADPSAGEISSASTTTGSPSTSSPTTPTSSPSTSSATGSGTTTSPPGSTPDDTAAREAWHKTRLARDIRPSVGAGALAGLGVLLWLGGMVVLVRRGLDRAGTWVRRPAVVSGAAIVLGVVLWFVGLANA